MSSFRPMAASQAQGIAPKITVLPGPPQLSTVIIETPPRQQMEPVEVQFDEGIITRMQEEMDVWRNKFFEMELQFSISAGEMKKIDFLEGRIKILQDANKSLYLENRAQANQNEIYRVRCDELEMEILELKMARQENNRLRELLDTAHEQLSVAKQTIADYEDQLADLAIKDQVIKDQQNKINQLLIEIELWKKRYQRLDQDRIIGMEEFKKSSEALRNSQFDELRQSGSMQAQGYQNELRNLRIQLERLQQENLELKENVNQLENTKNGSNSQLKELNSRLDSQNKEIKRLNDILLQRGQQNKQLELRIKELERQVSEKNILKDEIEKLKQQINDKNLKIQDQHNQITQLTNKIVELERLLQESKAYKEKIQQLQSEIAQLKAIIQGKEEEIAILKQKILNLEEQMKEFDKIIQQKSMLESKVAMLATEIERKVAQMKNKEIVIDELRAKVDENNHNLAEIEQLQQDVDSLNLELKGKDGLVQELDKKYHEALKYQEQVSQLETQVFDLQGKVAMLSSEIERQRIKLDKYKKDYDSQQDKINVLTDAQYDFESMSAAIQRFKEQEDQQNSEYENWRQLLLKADSESAELLKTKETLASEQSISQDQEKHLNEQIDQLNKLLEEERAKIEGLHKEIEKYQDLENKVYDMQNKCAMLSAEIERRSVKEKTKQQQFDELQQISNQQKEDLEKLTQIEDENQALNDQLKKNQDEIASIQKLLDETQEKLEKALSEKGDLINKIAMLSTEVERFKYKLNNKDQECQQVNAKNQELQAEILTLQDFPAQVDNLTAQVEELRQRLNEADLKQVQLTQNLDAVNHEKNQIAAEIQQHKDEVALANQLTDEAKKQLADFTEKFKAVEEENSSLRALESKLSEYQMKTALLASQIEAQNKKYQSKLDEIALLQQEYDKIKQAKLDFDDITGALERTQTMLSEKDKEQANFNTTIVEYQNKIQKMEDAKYQLESKMAMVSSEVERVKYKYDKLQKEYDEHHERLLQVEDELVEVKKDNHHLEDELHLAQQELQQIRKGVKA